MKTKRHCIIPVVLGVILFFSSPLLYAEITRGPFLQPTDDMETSVGVAWRTLNGGTSTISYGVNDVSENSVTVEPVEGIEGDITVYKYYAKLENLTPGTIYKYEVAGDGDVTPAYEFKTSPPDGNFKLLVGSDWHFTRSRNDYTRFLVLYEDMLAFDPDVVFLTGDIIGGSLEGYKNLFDVCKELFATAILIPVTGNHDDDLDGELINWREFFYIPENGPAGHEEITYSVDYGGAHFVALYLWDLDTEWLNSDLASQKAQEANFIFGGYHYPYTESSVNVMPFYDQHGVDIHFTGHNHRHHRSFPLLSSTISRKGIVVTPEETYYGANIEGTIYHKVRSAYYGKTKTYPDLHHVSFGEKSHIGYTEVTLSGKTCTVESYAYSNRILEDRYVIDKTDISQPPIPVVSDVNVAELGAYRALIEWRSDIPSRGQVEFGIASGNYPYLSTRDAENQVFTTSHKAALQCLTLGTTYYYRVKSWRAGKEGVSAEGSFTTNATSEEGELIAEFDFGPADIAPLDGTRVLPTDFDPTIRHGWYTKIERPNPWTGLGVGSASVRGIVDYCHVSNSNQYQTTWRTKLGNGEYDIEITVEKGAKYYFGDTRIDIEDGQVIFEVPKPADIGNTVWVWPAYFSIDDGFLDIELGYGDGSHERCTILNNVRIWTKGHYVEYPEPDVTPPSPTTDLAVSSTTDNSITLAWTAPGDDGVDGQATEYDIRYAASSGISGKWTYSSIHKVQNPPVPDVAGTTEYCTVTGLSSDRTYYFAMKTKDEVPNFSGFSNEASGTTVVQSPTEGDVNGDGKVDIRDLLIVARAFGSSASDPSWDARADLVRDSIIDIRDLLVVARNFGRSL